jgi:hypothetical protein
MITKHKVTVIQGVLGDMAVDQLGWLSEDKQKEFWRKHQKHIEQLKAKGEYLKPLEIEMSLEHDPLFDDIPIRTKAVESYRMTFLDLTKEKL